MKKLIVSLFFISSICVLSNATIPLFTIENYPQKETVCSLLNNYKRPITVLIIGTDSDYWAFRIAQNYNAIVVLMESKKPQEYLKACKEHDNKGTITLLSKKISAKDMIRLGECEHFDVVLAFSPFKQFDTDKEKDVIDAILGLSEHIFIETSDIHSDYLANANSV